eukprot:GEMP01100126.1.p1 GENE.GEMP01100126.1~~GEMP01100126.1.p1  ORF type:complete len:153 (+),score=44.93 GEMP01100126.1:130-588(+)
MWTDPGEQQHAARHQWAAPSEFPEKYTPDGTIRGSPQDFNWRAGQMNPIVSECRLESRILDTREGFLEKRVEFLERLVSKIVEQSYDAEEDARILQPRQVSQYVPKPGQLFTETFQSTGREKNEFRNVYVPKESRVHRTKAPPNRFSTLAGL